MTTPSKLKAWSKLSPIPVIGESKGHKIAYWAGVGMTQLNATIIAAAALSNYVPTPKVKYEMYQVFIKAYYNGAFDEDEDSKNWKVETYIPDSHYNMLLKVLWMHNLDIDKFREEYTPQEFFKLMFKGEM